MGEGTTQRKFHSFNMLCSEHFKEENMDHTSLSCVRVREGAVPTIFKSFPSYFQTDKKIRKAPISRPPPPIPQDICDDHEAGPSSSPDFDSPEKASLKRKLLDNEDRLQSYRRKIRRLSQCKRRLFKRNASLKKILVDL